MDAEGPPRLSPWRLGRARACSGRGGHSMVRSSTLRLAAFAASLIVAACGGGTPATPTPAPATVAPTAAVTEAPAATPAPTNASTGEPSVKGPAQASIGQKIDVAWTGPNAQ